MIKTILNIEIKVKRILETYPITRSNDKELILRVWESQGLYLTEQQKQAFYSCSPFESITRARRKIQENGNLPATETVRQARFKKEVDTRNHYSQAKEWQPVLDEEGHVKAYRPIY